MRILLSIIFLLLFGTVIHAQAWQWGKRGGCQFDGTNSQPHEQIKDIATDKNGNVYALGLVESSGGANIDGHLLTLNGEKDVVLTSFSCNGTYRWTKVIGGVSRDLPLAVATDTIGHVYAITWDLPNTSFDSDTTTSLSSAKHLALVQYDTSGNFKWLRQPQSDTGTYSYLVNNSDSYDLHVEGNGDAYWFCQLPAGLVSGGGGWALSAPTTCVLKYDAQGQMVNHINLQMQTTQVAFQGIGMAISKTGGIVIAGTYDNFNNTGTFAIGGQVITDPVMFLAAFSATGQNLWRKTSTSPDYGSFIWGRPQVDVQGNIYYSGSAPLSNSFNGFSFYNNQTTLAYQTPFIGKADSNGNHLWIKCAGGKAADAYNFVTLKSNNEIVISGSGNSVWWDTIHHIQGAPNCGYYIYTTRFDTAGNVLAMDSLKGTFGSTNYAYCNTTDKNGNLLIGGEFNITLDITGSQNITNSGGASDLFVAKYGYPCGCTAPLAGFISTNMAVNTVQLTYNGSMPIDSLRWDFGDGQMQTVTSNFISPITYTYATNGSFNTCVTVYNSCGSDSYCQQYSLSSGSIKALAGVKVYPNPITDNLVIEAAKGCTYTIMNTVGQRMGRGTLTSNKQSISTVAIPAGTYIIQLVTAMGERSAMTIVRQ